MATGFVQRFKGKIQADAIFVKGQAFVGPAASQSLSTSSTAFVTPSITAPFASIASGTNAYIYRLPKPTFAGQQQVIQLTAVSTLGVFFTASTDASALIAGSSINTTLKSTIASLISLQATSTSNWAIIGAYPGTYTSTGGTIWALSTST